MDALAPAASATLEWHLIGPLQSNKTRLVAEHFDWVQTVDRAKRSRARLSEQRPRRLPPLNVLIQVNVSGEASKSGVAPARSAGARARGRGAAAAAAARADGDPRADGDRRCSARAFASCASCTSS